MRLRLALLLLTASAMLPTWAADGARRAPGPDGCQVADEDPINPNAAADRNLPGARASQDHGGMPAGGNPDGGARTPRWHSFLPGMFR